MTSWVRLWHDMPTDPKWRAIAKRSNQRIGDVIAVFTFMMVNASGNATERNGTLSNFDCEDIAASLDLEAQDVQSILDAMQGKVLSGEALLGWDKRQPKREDSTAYQRKQAWKERKERDGTQRNAKERPDSDADADNTLAKASGANAPSDKAFWDNAKAYLGPSSGALIGKWSRDHGRPETAAAISLAQIERAADPVSYITRILRGKKPDSIVIGI